MFCVCSNKSTLMDSLDKPVWPSKGDSNRTCVLRTARRFRQAPWASFLLRMAIFSLFPFEGEEVVEAVLSLERLFVGPLGDPKETDVITCNNLQYSNGEANILAIHYRIPPIRTNERTNERVTAMSYGSHTKQKKASEDDYYFNAADRNSLFWRFFLSCASIPKNSRTFIESV